MTLAAGHESLQADVVIPNNSGEILEVVADYLMYAERYKNEREVPDMEIPIELTLDVLLAADYLDGEFAP